MVPRSSSISPPSLQTFENVISRNGFVQVNGGRGLGAASGLRRSYAQTWADVFLGIAATRTHEAFSGCLARADPPDHAALIVASYQARA